MARLRHLITPLALTCGLFLQGMTPACADDRVAIVASRQVHGMHLDDTTLRAIYLKKIFLDQAGDSLIPVNLPADHPLRQAFSEAVIHMNSSQLHNYWNRRYFHGVSPPYVLGSQTAVVRFIATTPGAIGYVDPCFVDDSVQTLMLLDLPGGTATHGSESCPPRPGT